jgi:RNA polymerase sigma-70 factor (ECF subfamily)
MGDGETTQYRDWIDRLQAGDDSALNEILAHFEGRLIQLSHLMLARFPGVRRWEQTGDVFQEAMLRLQRALLKVAPAHPRDFLKLAALQIRRELLSLAKAHQAQVRPSQAKAPGADGPDPPDEPSSGTDGPCELAIWTEFHQRAASMKDDLREVFDLIWYDGLTQPEAAAVLDVSERTVRSRWQEARLALRRALGGQLPGP